MLLSDRKREKEDLPKEPPVEADFFDASTERVLFESRTGEAERDEGLGERDPSGVRELAELMNEGVMITCG